MRAKHFWIAVLFSCLGAVSPACALVQTLGTISDPSLQTLINMGPNPVGVGGLAFSHFSLVNTLGLGGVTPDQIQVLPSNSGTGLQFVSSWFAANGSHVEEIISFNVQAIDLSKPVVQISLLSNGTAPAPSPGTFTTTTMVSELPTGETAAGIISTYNDGFTTPMDTTKPDINYVQVGLSPQTDLDISDTLSESSSSAGATDNGGVATESIVQNTFTQASTPVPEPGPLGWLMVSVAAAVGQLGRRWSIGSQQKSSTFL